MHANPLSDIIAGTRFVCFIPVKNFGFPPNSTQHYVPHPVARCCTSNLMQNVQALYRPCIIPPRDDRFLTASLAIQEPTGTAAASTSQPPEKMKPKIDNSTGENTHAQRTAPHPISVSAELFPPEQRTALIAVFIGYRPTIPLQKRRLCSV
jgi:hypothetical protein